MLGISELHRRNASPEHICCASALKAKLDVDETADREAAKARAKLTLQTLLLKKAVIVGPHWPAAGPLFDAPTLRRICFADCDVHHSVAAGQI
jgi:hypothetical protein